MYSNFNYLFCASRIILIEDPHPKLKGFVMDEPEAIARIKRGDISGLEELVLRYQARAVHAAYLIVQDGSTAEDVAQGAFLNAFQKIGQFDDWRPFGPWFLQSVVNAAIKEANRQKHSVPLDDAVDEDESSRQIYEYLANPDPCPEEIVMRSETRQAVQHALTRLAPEQRAAIVMRYYLELSEAEMTRELRRPASTVKWWLHAAKKRLRRLIHPDDISSGDHQERKEPEA
jgi:RNA polymerase sigma-70 factor, ECF subfamily